MEIKGEFFQARTNCRVGVLCGDRNNPGRPSLLIQENGENRWCDATEWVRGKGIGALEDGCLRQEKGQLTH